MQFVFCRCFLVTFIHFIYVRGSFHLSRLWNKVGDKSLKLLKRILLRKLRHVSHYIIWVSSYLPHLHSHSSFYLKLTKSKRAGAYFIKDILYPTCWASFHFGNSICGKRKKDMQVLGYIYVMYFVIDVWYWASLHRKSCCNLDKQTNSIST